MKWPLTCTYDMGWQKLASSKNYNSLSGHGFLVGGYTSKVIQCICYSKGCRYCVNAWKKQGLTWVEATKVEPMGDLMNNTTTHCCPQNYNGMVKSMEASRAVSMTTIVYNDEKDVLLTLVGDNDSTTCSNAKHLIKAILELNSWTNKVAHWEKMKDGSYVADDGKLPFHVKAINCFLATPCIMARVLAMLFTKSRKRGAGSSSLQL